MSTFKIPKQQIPLNNNNANITTTKGIAKALINNTSPQSDSENRPTGCLPVVTSPNAVNKKSPAAGKHIFVNGSSGSPSQKLMKSGAAAAGSNSTSSSPAGNFFKQSSISFNSNKPTTSSPKQKEQQLHKPILNVNELISSMRNSDTSSSDSSSSDDDEVLVVTASPHHAPKKPPPDKPLKPATVTNQLQRSDSQSKINHSSNQSQKDQTKIIKKEKLHKTSSHHSNRSPSSNSNASSHSEQHKTNGFNSLESTKIKPPHTSIKKPKTLKQEAIKVSINSSPQSTNVKPPKKKPDKVNIIPPNKSAATASDKEKSWKKSNVVGSSASPGGRPPTIQFTISSDEDEPLCNLSKTKDKADEVKVATISADAATSSSADVATKSKPSKKSALPSASANVVKDSDSEDNEDVPLSVIKLKAPLNLKHLKTKPFSPSSKNKNKMSSKLSTPNLMQKHFSTTTEQGKLKVEYQQPPLVVKLVKCLEVADYKEDPDKLKRVKTLVSLCAKNCTAFQRERIPAIAKELVLSKKVELDEKERWSNLTPEQKEAELKQKRLEKQRQLQLLKAEAPEKPKLVKQDDLLHENVKPLPKPTQIELPSNITMQMYGDILLVSEFMSIFRGILSPNESYDIDFSVDFFVEALSVGNDGFLFLSSVIELLLKSLLQDQMNELFTDLDTNLSKVTVTCHSVSELCRIYLSSVFTDPDRGGLFRGDNALISAKDKLNNMDYIDLEPSEKLAIIVFFCHEVLLTDVYEHFWQEKQLLQTENFKWKMKALQDYNGYMREKAEKEAELLAKKAEIVEKSNENRSCYGEQSAETTATTSYVDPEMDSDKFLAVAEEHAILTSSMSRRQQEVELAKLRKDREERFRKLKMQQEMEEDRIVSEKEKSEAEFEKNSTIVQKMSRLGPIGYDRYHNKYWVLDSVPGILVERCWADEDISFETKPNSTGTLSTPVETDGAVSTVKVEEDEIQPMNPISPPNESGRQEIPEKCLPRVGNNAWVIYNTPEQLEALIKRLYDWGNRESALKNELKRKKDKLMKQLEAAKIKQLKKEAKNKNVSSSLQKNSETPISENAAESVRSKEGDKTEAVLPEKQNQDIVVLEDEDDDEEKLPVMPKNVKNHYLSFLQSDMKELHVKLYNGGLSWGDPEEIENKIDTSANMEDIKRSLVKMYECVIPKFLTGVLKPDSQQLYAADQNKTQWTITSPEQSSNENEDKEEDAEKKIDGGGGGVKNEFSSWCSRLAAKRLTEGSRKWHDAVVNAPTWSRLHVLLGVLDSCVRWEKSVAKSGCTVCRKKSNEDKTLLCDECNRAYHMYCLRPALKEIPIGDWLCPGCRPRDVRPKNYKEVSESDEDDKKAAGTTEDKCNESEEFCFCCLDGGDELILCNSCPRVYHLNCHQPPMRRVPRGNWNCMVCVNPRLKRKKGFLFAKEHQEGDGSSCNSADESEEESSASGSRSKQRTKPDDSESDEDSNVRRSTRATKGTRSDNLYRSTLERSRKGASKYVEETDGSISDDDSSIRSSRRSHQRENRKPAKSYESSDDDGSIKKRGRGSRNAIKKGFESTSAEVSPERDSLDNGRPKSSKRKRGQIDSSESENESTSHASKSAKRNSENDHGTANKQQNGALYEMQEVTEEVVICEKIFYDIKSRSNFMFFENIAEVDAYAGVENRVDFSTIKVMMQEKDYIWKGFIRDVAFIVNNALDAFEESHKVYKAAVKLDERMHILMVNLPIMRKWYDKVRNGLSEGEIEKEMNSTVDDKQPSSPKTKEKADSKLGDVSHSSMNEAETADGDNNSEVLL